MNICALNIYMSRVPCERGYFVNRAVSFELIRDRLMYFIGIFFYCIFLDNIYRATSKTSAHHTRAGNIRVQFCKIDQKVKLFTTHFILVLQAMMRCIHQLTQLGQYRFSAWLMRLFEPFHFPQLHIRPFGILLRLLLDNVQKMLYVASRKALTFKMKQLFRIQPDVCYKRCLISCV